MREVGRCSPPRRLRSSPTRTRTLSRRGYAAVPAAKADFRARLLRDGINLFVPIPKAVSLRFGKRGQVPVKGKLNGKTAFIATLMPLGGGRHRMFLHGAIRKAAGAKEGDILRIALEPDSASRIPEPSRALKVALAEAGLAAVFAAQIPSRRKELTRWVNQAKQAATKARRIRRVVEVLRSGGRLY